MVRCRAQPCQFKGHGCKGDPFLGRGPHKGEVEAPCLGRAIYECSCNGACSASWSEPGMWYAVLHGVDRQQGRAAGASRFLCQGKVVVRYATLY